MSLDNRGRASLVSVITTPLGFFALSLLIVEGFIGIILIGSSFSGNQKANLSLSGNQKFYGLLIGAGLFILVVVVVAVLVWKKPQHLTFTGGEHLQHDRMALGDQDTELSKSDETKAQASVSSADIKDGKPKK